MSRRSVMRANVEMAVYLEELIEHEGACEVENCALCESAQNIYWLVRNLIFSEVVYPDVPIASRAPVIEAENPAAHAGMSFMPRAA